MDYAYYPGCSLTGSARRLDQGVRAICSALGHTPERDPRLELLRGPGVRRPQGACRAFRARTCKKAARSLRGEIVAPCPACYKNLKEANGEKAFTVLSPLELLDEEALAVSPAESGP